MSFQRSPVLALAALILSVSASAAAQVVVHAAPIGRRAVVVAAPQPPAAQPPALWRISTAASALRVEAERRGLADVAQSAGQLERLASRDVEGRRHRGSDDALRDLDATYRDARRRLFAYGNRLDEALLDVWDELAFQVRAVRLESGAMPLQPVQPLPPPPPPPPPPAIASYVFDGAFEQAAVRFQGTPEQLHSQCVQFVRAMRLGNVDDLRLPSGAHAHNGASYWGEDASCSIAVLNAQAQNVGGPSVSGTVEDLPFTVTGDVLGLLSTYLPRALAGNRFIDDLVIDGRAYHNNSGYWSPAEATQIVASQAGGAVVPSPASAPPAPRWLVEGSVDGRSFRILAPSTADLEAACRGFFANQGLPIARQVTLGTQTFVQPGNRPWDVAGACQLIAAQARQL